MALTRTALLRALAVLAMTACAGPETVTTTPVSFARADLSPTTATTTLPPTTTTTAPPTTTTTHVYRAADLPPPAPPPDPGTIEAIIAAHFPDVYAQALAVARCESGLNPAAVSRTNDHGLFQLNIVHADRFPAVTGRPWSDVYDAGANTLYARWLYEHSGWAPWTCQP